MGVEIVGPGVGDGDPYPSNDTASASAPSGGSSSSSSSSTANYETSLCRDSINVAPPEFVFMAVCNRFGPLSEVYESALFRVFCEESTVVIEYESGVKDTLGVIDSIGIVLVTKNASAVRIALNGEQVKQVPSGDYGAYFPSLPNEYVDHCLTIGSAQSCELVWRGRMDEFVFYHRALDSADIRKLHYYLVARHSPGIVDIVHSEWAYAPPFSPALADYTAVLPPRVGGINVDVVKGDASVEVTVDGGEPPAEIELTETDDTVSIEVGTKAGRLKYSLRTEKNSYEAIYVDRSAAGANTGTSWGDAYTEMQAALDDAALSGKEIRVAEGVYSPSLESQSGDPRSVTFRLRAGTEIRGGFRGDELDGEPRGSSYETILSGDIAANDDSVSTWPPVDSDFVYLDDNAYHVVTMEGAAGTRSIRLEGVVITGGVADGAGTNGVGGGIYNPRCRPTLEFCGLRKNIARDNGGGIYCGAGLHTLKNCLVESNLCLRGGGAGLYARGNEVSTLDASVFQHNRTMDTTEAAMGGACRFESAKATLINMAIVSNHADSGGAAIAATGSELDIINCTFTANTGGLAGVVSATSTIAITNTILWANTSGIELAGGGCTVAYSCVAGGYEGEGNFTDDPLFVDAAQPAGANGYYGDNDDGLRLQPDSPCRDAGTDDGAPEFDLILMTRPYGAAVDVGAYEFEAYAKQPEVLGRLFNGAFVPIERLVIMDYLYHWKYVRVYSRSKVARVLRIALPRNKHTEKPNTVHIYVRGFGADNQPLGGTEEVRVDLVRVGQDKGNLYFQSMTPTWGKPLLFVNDTAFHNWPNPWAYVIYFDEDASMNFRLPHNQFN